MAVLANNLTSGIATGISSTNTASITPRSQKIILLSVSSIVGSGSANIPTPTLSGWTFHQVNTVSYATSQRITLFTAIGSGSGAISLDFAGQSQTAIGWCVDQFLNTKITGTGGANAIVQNGTNSANTGATSYTITLGAFANTNNATYSTVAKNSINNVAPAGIFVELAEITNTSPNWDNETMWANSNQTTVSASFAGSGGDAYGAIAVEIAFQALSGINSDI